MVNALHPKPPRALNPELQPWPSCACVCALCFGGGVGGLGFMGWTPDSSSYSTISQKKPTVSFCVGGLWIPKGKH